MVKLLIKAALQVWLMISILLAFVIFTQMFKDEEFRKEKLESPKEFIEEYKLNYGKLPSVEEFELNFFLKNIDYRIENEQEYTLEVWRGEWYESYSSKTDSYTITNSYTGDIVCIVIVLLIGALPMFLFYLFNRKVKE